MLIQDRIIQLCEHYKPHIGLIRGFAREILALAEAQDLTEVWVERYENPYRVAVTPLRNGKVGQLIWGPDIPEFDILLSFLRQPEIGLRRQTGESLGKVEGLRLTSSDLRHLSELLAILDG